MPEKRDKKRHPKRFTLRFGADEAMKIGFTEDVSREGLFIKTTHFYPPNSHLIVELAVRNEIVRIEGIVRWMKRVPPNLIHIVKKSGLGIRITRFISGEETYRSLFENQ